MASPTDNIAMMRRVVMGCQQDGDYSIIDEVFHPDFIDHTAERGQPNNRTGVHAVMRFLHASFNGIEMHLDHCVSDGTTIMTNKTLTGTQVADFAGNPGDGKRRCVRVMDTVTIKDGKIYEHWVCVRPGVEV